MLYILPTDTCYGLAWEFTESDYLEIYRLKGRDFMKPLAILVEDYDDMKRYIDISDTQIEFLHNYPHPWSFLGKRICPIPSWMDENQYEMLSLRVARVCLRAPYLLQGQEQKVFPLYLTSANLSGHPELKTLTEARVFFPWIEGIDGGVCDHPPSDIFSLWKNGEQLIYLRKNY